MEGVGSMAEDWQPAPRDLQRDLARFQRVAGRGGDQTEGRNDPLPGACPKCGHPLEQHSHSTIGRGDGCAACTATESCNRGQRGAAFGEWQEDMRRWTLERRGIHPDNPLADDLWWEAIGSVTSARPRAARRRASARRWRPLIAVIALLAILAVIIAVVDRPGLPVRYLTDDVRGSCTAHGSSVTVAATVTNLSAYEAPIGFVAYVYDSAGGLVGEQIVRPGLIAAGTTSKAVSFSISVSGVPASCSLRATEAPPPGYATGTGAGT